MHLFDYPHLNLAEGMELLGYFSVASIFTEDLVRLQSATQNSFAFAFDCAKWAGKS